MTCYFVILVHTEVTFGGRYVVWLDASRFLCCTRGVHAPFAGDVSRLNTAVMVTTPNYVSFVAFRIKTILFPEIKTFTWWLSCAKTHRVEYEVCILTGTTLHRREVCLETCLPKVAREG